MTAFVIFLCSLTSMTCAIATYRLALTVDQLRHDVARALDADYHGTLYVNGPDQDNDAFWRAHYGSEDPGL